MYDDCVKRLAQLGYTVVDTDEGAISFEIDKALRYIEIQCNRSDFLEEWTPFIVDYVCGQFLSERKDLGLLPAEFFSYEAHAKEIKEGDVTIKFAGPSEGQMGVEGRFNEIVERLISGLEKNVITPYRKLRW